MEKIALITGAARRIGAQITRTLHAEGFTCIVHCLQSYPQACDLAEQLNLKRENSVQVLQADLSKPAQCKKLINDCINAYGRLDVLINNAAKFFPTTIGKVDESAWDDLLDSNLKGPFFLSQAASEHLSKAKGCIINIADTVAQKPLRDHSVYCISKAGLWMLTKSLAKELAPNVRVNAIAPGAICWPEGTNSLDTKVKTKIISETPLRCSGTPSDVTSAVKYLVTDAVFMTGQMLMVDGGRA